jgi:hypothetical protein
MAKIASIDPSQPCKELTNQFDFVSLPAELRVEIYRYTLECKFSIKNNHNELVVDEKDKVNIHLLRTCKQIYQEGSDIFYGENRFWFFRKHGLLEIPVALSKHKLDWLKEVTVSVPFLSNPIWIHHDAFCTQHSSALPFEDCLVSSSCTRADLLPNMWVRAALDALASAAQLRRLHLVILPDYTTRTPERHTYALLNQNRMCCEFGDHTLFRMVNPDVWHDLGVFLRSKPALEVSCTRLYYADPLIYKPDRLEEQQALMCKLHNRLGIWDLREAAVVGGNWELPKKTAQYLDLSDLSQAFHLMFGE